MNHVIAIIFGLIVSSTSIAETIWLDVRSNQEFEANNLPNSIHIPHKKIRDLAVSKLPNKDATINVYCAAGYRAGIAKEVLQDLGYVNVVNVISLEKARNLMDKEVQ